MDLIAKSVASVPWGMKKRLTSGETKVVPDHPLNRLLRRPNPDTS
jgi:phage portal protein BeeE